MIDIDEKQCKDGTLNGIYEAIAELIGFDNTIKFYDSFHGSQINFPTRLFSKDFVSKEAKKMYDGTSESINIIATKFNYSERTIRKMLKNNIDE